MNNQIQLSDLKSRKEISTNSRSVKEIRKYGDGRIFVLKIAGYDDQHLQSEIRYLSRINHENIVKFYGAIRTTENIGQMITEYADCGTVYDFLHDKEMSENQNIAHRDRYVPYSIKLSWMLQCAKAVAFLHDMTPKIFHNDLRTRHLLLSNNFETLKICDFSTAESDRYFNLFAEKTDIYNFGIVIWETFIAQVKNFRELAVENSEFINAIILLCCDSSPINRPKIRALVKILDSQYQQCLKDVHNLDRVSWSNLELIRPAIGRGNFGVVFKTIWSTKDGKRTIAVKRVGPETVGKEVKCWALVNHENIVKLYGTTTDNEGEMIVAMEYAECGSLYSFLHGERTEDPERRVSILDKLNWMLQCAKGAAYLHDFHPKIIHRDLKSHNLLLFNNYRTLKICDFGTVRPMATMMSVAGTAAYMAPEVSLGKNYTEKCDVYSFGILCWEIMSQKMPFYHIKDPLPLVIMNLAYQNERPLIEDVGNNKQTEPIRVWINQCWDFDPEKRPTMQEMVIRLRAYFHVTEQSKTKSPEVPEMSFID